MPVISPSVLSRKSFLTLLLLSLCACGSEPTTGASPAASATPTPGPNTVALTALAEGLIDASGCWRPASASGNATGNAFNFNRVAPDAYVFSSTPMRTKLVFRADRSFQEVNYDDKKPFFPPGYIHSTGTISADGNTINRVLEGSPPQTFRRCELVGERVFIPVTEPTRQPPTASNSPTPEATYAPLSPGETPERPTPVPSSSSPTPEPTP